MDNFIIKIVNIVVAGSWNTRIFSPKWLIDNFHLNDVEGFEKKIGINVNFEEREFRFDFCGISFVPSQNNLIIQINDLTDLENKCHFSESILRILIETLPHTPIKGIGFNFVYEFSSKTNSKIAKHILQKNIEDDFFKKIRNDYQRQESNYILTALGHYEYENPGILGTIEFNFNYQKPSDIAIEDTFCNHYKYIQGLLNE